MAYSDKNIRRILFENSPEENKEIRCRMKKKLVRFFLVFTSRPTE